MTRNKQNQAENSPFLKWAGQLNKFVKFLICVVQIMEKANCFEDFFNM